MMRSTILLFVGLCLMLLPAACSPGIDRGKFRGADRAAGAVQAAIAEKAAYGRVDELVRQFSDETSLLQGRVNGKEKTLAGEYSALLAMYRDGMTLWRYQSEFSGHAFVPKGLIYVGQDVEPIVAKYRLETEAHVFAPTGQSWKSIPADSIRTIWFNAEQQLKRIETLFKEAH